MELSRLEAFTRNLVVVSVLSIEVLAVIIVLGAILFGTSQYLYHLMVRAPESYEYYKAQMAKSLLLGLQLLVAADVVRTVALEPTLKSVVVLGVLVMVRTFLSWSTVVEIEGRWPWQSPARPAEPERHSPE
jgi:uncharacterized membrane protein